MTDFSKVAQDYSQRFNVPEYYGTLITALEKYATDANIVLEIGAANGIVPETWDKIRREIHLQDMLIYHSVEPVIELVQIAEGKAADLRMTYLLKQGTLENALEVTDIEKLDLLITSRCLHEIWSGYKKDTKKLYSQIGDILRATKPSTVVHGILNRVSGLSANQRHLFSRMLEETIGHSHDPEEDYLSFDELIKFMQGEGYNLIEQKHITGSYLEFPDSPWRFAIGVFKT